MATSVRWIVDSGELHSVKDHDWVDALKEVDDGADINTIGSRGTLLTSAAIEGKMRFVLELLDRGADVNTVGGGYGTQLAATAYMGKDSVVQLLLDLGANVNTVRGDYGTALGAAAFSGRISVVQLLLDRGADINAVGGNYGTALGAAAFSGRVDVVQLLLERRANINTVGGDYGSALGAAVYQGENTVIQLLLERGADVNVVGGDYGTALGAAAFKGEVDIAQLLLGRGADVKIVGGDYGTALGAAACSCSVSLVQLLLNHGADVNTVGGVYGTPLKAAMAMDSEQIASLLLACGADIDLVCGERGSVLGIAAYEGNKKWVELLLTWGADTLHVGGNYRTFLGGYPTALDAARCGGKATPHVLERLTHAIMINVRYPSPPFPMPATNFYCMRKAVAKSNNTSFIPNNRLDSVQAAGVLTPAQADILCQAFTEADLVQMLVNLVGIGGEAAQQCQKWIQSDTRYFLSQGFDIGLAYAAARVGWKHFNDPLRRDDTSICIQRGRWLTKAKEFDEARAKAIYKRDSGQELIKSPYSVMPRRIWDVKSNRVVDYRMLEAEAHSLFEHGEDVSTVHATFWAITHSWTTDMEVVKTPINQYQWPVPIPAGVDLEQDLRAELLDFGANYIWLDVLCLRQQDLDSSRKELIRQGEWRIDVPTIGNIYRQAERLVRYFNGLGKPFRECGWGNDRHWLRRAWTLQEIRSEHMTFNGGVSRGDSHRHVFLNTPSEIAGKPTTLRRALRPVLRLASVLDSPDGCSVYQLVREMANRCASQETDKIAGLFYLLDCTTERPTYDETISDETAWAQCFHVLPFQRKVEILFDFPYRGNSEAQFWFPTWDQLRKWPKRDPNYDHSRAKRLKDPDPKYADLTLESHTNTDPAWLFVSYVWVLPDVVLRVHATRDGNEYVVEKEAKVFGFYAPFTAQEPIQLQDGQRFTLAVLGLENVNNWVLCKEIEKQKMRCTCIGELGDGKESVVEVTKLHKVGVLRTDSCSELLGDYHQKERGASLMSRIHCLFV